MVLTAAERAKRYRDGKRDDSEGSTVTKRDETVTKPKRDGVTKSEDQADPNKAPGSSDSIGLRHEIVEGEKVYNRQAVRYNLGEPWDTRPQPDDPLDIPTAGGRGLYARLDGSTYQIDATGTTHDRNAEGLVYADKDYKGVA